MQECRAAESGELTLSRESEWVSSPSPWTGDGVGLSTPSSLGSRARRRRFWELSGEGPLRCVLALVAEALFSFGPPQHTHADNAFLCFLSHSSTAVRHVLPPSPSSMSCIV